MPKEKRDIHSILKAVKELRKWATKTMMAKDKTSARLFNGDVVNPMKKYAEARTTLFSLVRKSDIEAPLFERIKAETETFTATPENIENDWLLPEIASFSTGITSIKFN